MGLLAKYCLFLILILSSFSVTANIYKWKDANGQVHYSAQPPKNNTESKKVKIKKHKIDHNNLKRIEKLTNQSTNYNSTAEQTTKQNNTEFKKDKKRCEKYTRDYERYKKEGILGINTATGKVEKMKGGIARTALKNAKDNVNIFCN